MYVSMYMYVNTHGPIYVCTYTLTFVLEYLISLYDAPVTQRASFLALQSCDFGPDGEVNYEYIVINSINPLLIGSLCIPNDTHTNHV